jgi:hypothetical protein
MSEEKKDEKKIIDLGETSKAVSDTYNLYTSFEVKKQTAALPEQDLEADLGDTTTTPPGRVESIKSLKPELQKPIKNLLSAIPKEQIAKLVNPSQEQKARLFNDKGSNTFGDLSESDKTALMEKMDSWKVNEEVAEINASVSVSWLNSVAAPEKKKNNSGTGNLNNKNG